MHWITHYVVLPRWLKVLLILPVVVGVVVIAVEAGYWFEPLRKQVVIEQVDNGWTISECVVAHPCKVTRVARNAIELHALVWVYTSGKPLKPDWREK